MVYDVNIDRMDIKRIRYFLALGESLNFTQTAKELDISQPALTKAILRLEEDIGGKLLRREGKHTHLTALAKAMHLYFRELDDAAKRIEIRSQQLTNGEASQLQIAVMCTIGPTRFTDFLEKFRKKYPDIQITLHNADPKMLPGMLLNGDVDCALVGFPIDDEQRLKYVVLFEEPMVLAHAKNHPFSLRESVSFEEVMHEPYLDRLRCEIRSAFTNEIRTNEIEPLFAIRSDREEWIQALVVSGVGVSIMPVSSTAAEGISFTEIDDFKFTRKVSLAIPTGREDNSAIRAFLKEARAHKWSKRIT